RHGSPAEPDFSKLPQGKNVRRPGGHGQQLHGRTSTLMPSSSRRRSKAGLIMGGGHHHQQRRASTFHQDNDVQSTFHLPGAEKRPTVETVLVMLEEFVNTRASLELQALLMQAARNANDCCTVAAELYVWSVHRRVCLVLDQLTSRLQVTCNAAVSGGKNPSAAAGKTCASNVKSAGASVQQPPARSPTGGTTSCTSMAGTLSDFGPMPSITITSVSGATSSYTDIGTKNAVASSKGGSSTTTLSQLASKNFHGCVHAITLLGRFVQNYG
ncbi:unnamed protein product, partial [Amoebophrya sp. A120]